MFENILHNLNLIVVYREDKRVPGISQNNLCLKICEEPFVLLIRVDRAFTEFELGSVVEKSLDCFVLWQVREIVLLLVGCYLVIEVLKEQVSF